VLAARGRATTGVAAGAQAALPFAVALDARYAPVDGGRSALARRRRR
jgi:hypothetical protein